MCEHLLSQSADFDVHVEEDDDEKDQEPNQENDVVTDERHGLVDLLYPFRCHIFFVQVAAKIPRLAEKEGPYHGTILRQHVIRGLRLSSS